MSAPLARMLAIASVVKAAGLVLPTANLAGLYRFDSPGFYHLTSGAVDTAYDQSGAGHDLAQGTAVNRPLIASGGGPTGQDCGDFRLNAGLSRHLINASMGLGSPVTIYSVTQAPGTTRYVSDAGFTPDGRIVYGTGTAINMYCGGVGPSIAVTPGTWIVHCAAFNGASSFGIVNGGAPVSVSLSAPTDAGFTLGGRAAGDPSAGLDEKLLACAIYSAAHSSGTAAGIISTLRAWSGV